MAKERLLSEAHEKHTITLGEKTIKVESVCRVVERRLPGMRAHYQLPGDRDDAMTMNMDGMAQEERDYSVMLEIDGSLISFHGREWRSFLEFLSRTSSRGFVILLAVVLFGCFGGGGSPPYTPDASTHGYDGGAAVTADNDSGVGSSVAERPDAGAGGSASLPPHPDAGPVSEPTDGGTDPASFDASAPDAGAADAGKPTVCYTPSTCSPFWTPACKCGPGCALRGQVCAP